MRDLGCTNMKCRMCLIGGLPADVQYWGTSQTTNGQHIACYVRRVSVKCRSRVGQQSRYITQLKPETESLTTLIPSNMSHQTHAEQIISTEIRPRLKPIYRQICQMLVDHYNNQVSENVGILSVIHWPSPDRLSINRLQWPTVNRNQYLTDAQPINYGA